MDKRQYKRLSARLPIMLPTGKAQTQNVSSGGVYFELEADDANHYSVGQDIPIWLHANHDSSNQVLQQIWLFDKAVIVRKEKSVNETQGDRWGFGLMFSKEMDTMLCTTNGYYL